MSELELINMLYPKILVATFCGFIIGWERELKQKVAGIRTHILVCVGACLYTSVGFVLAKEYQIDPSRIIGQIVTGVGFLGAGVILVKEDKVVGVTSAAFIWLIASIGVFIGIGYLLTPILLTLGLLLQILILEKVESRISKGVEEKINKNIKTNKDEKQ